MGNPETFSLRLREARERKKLTQKQLAELAGITAASVSAYEKLDSAKSPSIEIAIQLAKALGVSLDWLAGISDDPQAVLPQNTLDAGRHTAGDYMRMIALLVLQRVGKPSFFGRGADIVALKFVEGRCIDDFLQSLSKFVDLYDASTIDKEQLSFLIDGYIGKHEHDGVWTYKDTNAEQIKANASPADFDDIAGDDDLPF